MKLKKQYESIWIKDPFGPGDVWTKSIPESMYAHYYTHGYSTMFDKSEEVVDPNGEEVVNPDTYDRAPDIQPKYKRVKTTQHYDNNGNKI
jgi:hypothetical protein